MPLGFHQPKYREGIRLVAVAFTKGVRYERDYDWATHANVANVNFFPAQSIPLVLREWAHRVISVESPA